MTFACWTTKFFISHSFAAMYKKSAEKFFICLTKKKNLILKRNSDILPFVQILESG